MKQFLFIIITIFAAPALIFAQNFKIGDLITNSDGSKGIVFYVNADRTDGWMIALSDLQTNNWGLSDDIMTINNINLPNQLLEETDGFANTSFIREFHEINGYSPSYAAGTVDFENGWYIPTAGQLMKLCSVLEIINNKLSLYGGSEIQQKPYFSSSEPDSPAQVWAVDFGNYSHDWGGQFETHYKNENAYFRAVRNIIFAAIPTVADITIPESFCDGEPLVLQPPTTQFADSQGWQIAPDENFADPIAYNGENIDFSFNGWYIRYFASNEFGTVYSNTVGITIKPAPYVGEIEGEQFIYVTDHGRYTYSIEPVEGAYDYVWFIDNNWAIDNAFGSNSCTVNVNTIGAGTLTVKVYSECGFIEKKIHIEHSLQPDIVVFPNPTYGDFKLYLYGMDGETLIEIYDAIGQRIARFTENANVSGTLLNYTLKYHACGMYLITASNRYRSVTKKIVKNTR